MPLTPRERDILTRMAAADPDSEDYLYQSELTFAKGGGWWFGLEKVAARVAKSLVYRAYVTNEVGGYDSDYQVYVINEDGRNAVQEKPHATGN